MNRNHYDPQRIYSAKIARVQACIEEVAQAEAILDQLPEEAAQRLWVKTLEAMQPAKTRGIGKGLAKRSLRKTLQGLMVSSGLHRPSK
jgi:hypothetical protein